MSGQAHLGHLLLVQVEHLPGAAGGDLLVGQVARVGAVTTVPRQHEDHLEDGRPHGVLSTFRYEWSGEGEARPGGSDWRKPCHLSWLG